MARPPLQRPPVIGHLFGLLLSAVIAAAPPSLQCSHQTGQQQAGSQDAEDAGKAVQPERATVWTGAAVAVEVTAAGTRPPLLLQDVEVSLLL